MNNSKQIAPGIVALLGLGLAYWAENYPTIDASYKDFFYAISASFMILAVWLNIRADAKASKEKALLDHRINTLLMSVTVEKEFIRELPKATAEMSGTFREVSVDFSSEVFCTSRLVGQKLVVKLLALQVESKKFVEYVVLETESKEWEKFIPFLAATNKVDGLDYFIALIPGNENFLPDSAGRKIIVKYTTGHYDFIDRPTSELVIDSERLREFEIDNLTYTTSSSAQPESPASS